MENYNPHHVLDGKWGGWGPPYWFCGEPFGFKSADVVEREETGMTECGFRWRWVNVWIDADKAWRMLTTDEVNNMVNADTLQPNKQ